MSRRSFGSTRARTTSLNARWKFSGRAPRKRFVGHLKRLMSWRIKLSDLETLNYGVIWVGLGLLLIYTVAVVASADGTGFGQIIATVMYVFGFIESTLVLPFYLQQLVRLQEITSRLGGLEVEGDERGGGGIGMRKSKKLSLSPEAGGLGLILATVLALALSGCVTLPPETRPAAEQMIRDLPTTWTTASGTTATGTTATGTTRPEVGPLTAGLLDLVDDALLRELVLEALDANHDLLAAAHRLEASRRLLAETRALRSPAVDAGATRGAR